MTTGSITILVDNQAGDGLMAEHGLSLWIETEGRRILFDAGHGPALESNARALGVDLGTSDTLVVSHGHYDHTGGIPQVLGTLGARKSTATRGRYGLATASEAVRPGRFRCRRKLRPPWTSCPCRACTGFCARCGCLRGLVSPVLSPAKPPTRTQVGRSSLIRREGRPIQLSMIWPYGFGLTMVSSSVWGAVMLGW
jgi:hypothetical protein